MEILILELSVISFFLLWYLKQRFSKVNNQKSKNEKGLLKNEKHLYENH